VATGIGKGLY